MQYQYQVADAHGKIERGSAEADSREQMISKLKAQGKYALEIKEKKGPAISFQFNSFLGTGRLSDNERLNFTQQLTSLLNARIPLERALGTLSRLKFTPQLNDIILQLRRLLQEGLSFSGALEQFPRQFPPLFINMVRVGETGGILPQVMTRLAQYQEEDLNFRRHLTGSLVYPVFVTITCIGSFIFLVTSVIPQFQKIFQDMGSELPFITQVVLFFGKLAMDLWYIPVLAIGIICFWYFRELETAEGRYRIDKIKLKIPIIGKILEKIATQKMVQSLGLLVGSGVSLLTSINIASAIIGNEVFAKALRDTEQKVRQGNNLASSLMAADVFPTLAVEMIAVGEEGGNLDFMLEQVAKTYDHEIEHQMSILLTLFEPIIMLLILGVVAIFAVAVILPVMNLNNRI